MIQFKSLLMFLCGALFLLAVAACDDGGSGDGGDADTDGDADSDTGEDTDTNVHIVGPYEDLDCAVTGQDEANCEYWICQNEAFYEQQTADFVGEPSPVNAAKLQCYQELESCMREACPPGTAAPIDHDGRSEAGFYLCGNDYDTCNLYAEQ